MHRAVATPEERATQALRYYAENAARARSASARRHGVTRWTYSTGASPHAERHRPELPGSTGRSESRSLAMNDSLALVDYLHQHPGGDDGRQVVSRRPIGFWVGALTGCEQPITVRLTLGFSLLSHSAEGKMFAKQVLSQLSYSPVTGCRPQAGRSAYQSGFASARSYRLTSRVRADSRPPSITEDIVEPARGSIQGPV